MAIAEIHVTLKPTLFDAQGATVLKALRNLGHNSVENVRIGKFITIEIPDAMLGPAMEQDLDRMCQELLANPVIEDYEITLAPGTTTGTAAVVPPAGITATAPATPSALAASEQLAAEQIGASATAQPDPFAMDFDSFDALPAPEKLAVQELAWRLHGAVVLQQLNDLRAAWVLMVGGQVVESGATMDDYPSETRLDTLGTANGLVPFVFVKPGAV